MVHIISACADQTEAINNNLPSNSINNPYHLVDVLPDIEKNLNEKNTLRDLWWEQKLH